MLKAWIQLARRWLKLPKGNPHIPAGDPASVQVWNPGEGYLRYRKVGFWISALPMTLMGVGLLLGAFLFPSLVLADGDTPGFVAVLVGLISLGAGLFLIASILFNWATLHLELDMLRYTLTDLAIRLRRGVTSIQEVTLSYANIQNVQYQQGPLQRMFGVADLIVQTAGGSGQQPGQPGAQGTAQHQGLIKGISEPEKLRELILERVRAVKGAGLGDDHSEHILEQAGSVDSPQGRALLREIRDALAQIPG